MFGWTSLDTWIACTAALAAMSCAIPGTFLVLRKQSMLGDALSHTVLPGIVAAFLFAGAFGGDSNSPTSHSLLLVGAVASGLVTTFLSETVRKLGGVEDSAALGIVYTSMFAFGLLLIRLFADSVHLDAECVLFGAVETAVLETWGDTDIPSAMLLNGGLLILNGLLVLLCLKELRLTAFDPALGASLGIRPALVTYGLMAMTSLTLVAAFESVGLILVVTVLVTPASTALLLSDRLSVVLVSSVVIAGLAGFVGHASSIMIPSLVFRPLGFTTVSDSSTAGMAALVCGVFFALAFLFGRRRGLVTSVLRNWKLSFRIACEDLLGLMYRSEEAAQAVKKSELALHDHHAWLAPVFRRLAFWRLTKLGLVATEGATCKLTPSGHETAERIVRSHRLWESYMARHFSLPGDHLHAPAARVEHFLDENLLAELDRELDRPGADPHGRSIPTTTSPATEQPVDSSSDGADARRS